MQQLKLKELNGKHCSSRIKVKVGRSKHNMSYQQALWQQDYQRQLP